LHCFTTLQEKGIIVTAITTSDISEHLWLLFLQQKRAYRSNETPICILKKMLKTLLFQLKKERAFWEDGGLSVNHVSSFLVSRHRK
jgi:hypothetical protein